MLSRLHPLTSLGLLLALLSPVAFAIHQPQVGVLLLFLAYGFALLEFQKYTSNFQFAMILICGTAMGISLDLLYGHWPWLTIGMALAASATIVRQVFMPWFTYVDKLWLDTSKAAGACFCWWMAIHDTSFTWDLWLLPLLPPLVAAGLTFSYVQDARKMKKRTRFGYRVQIGKSAPDFELPDQAGAPIKLSDYKGKHPVLLIFVRGDWCPGCHMMLRTYERNRAKFMEKDIHVLGIGPDDISVNKDMVERIGVNYRMLSDDKQEVSSQYGVVYSNPLLELSVDYAEGIPLPASFLIDINGVVRYASRPDRVGEFLDPELIFNVLEDIPVTGEVAWS